MEQIPAFDKTYRPIFCFAVWASAIGTFRIVSDTLVYEGPIRFDMSCVTVCALQWAETDLPAVWPTTAASRLHGGPTSKTREVWYYSRI